MAHERGILKLINVSPQGFMFGMLGAAIRRLSVGPRNCDARQPNGASDAWD
jgi:hypothetical protein